MKHAYYNEIDPFAAEWLRNLIKSGHIAPGVVDERSIEDVTPEELREFTQCHFFAGIGVWSYALRLAGVPDDTPVWTGSCPCQPFSTAGKGAGFADERHLWPAWFWLIEQCRPPIIFGEQVASKAAEPWIDLVSTDLEAVGYAFGSVAFPSAGVGAPHIRDRAYWMANADSIFSDKRSSIIRGSAAGGNAEPRPGFGGGSVHGGLANAESERRQGKLLRASGRLSENGIAQDSNSFRLANANIDGCDQTGERESTARDDGTERNGRTPARESAGGPTNGMWRDADWLFCRDGKWRPVEPGTSPLAHGATARVGRLRAFGNAINAQAAAEFIKAGMTTEAVL